MKKKNRIIVFSLFLAVLMSACKAPERLSLYDLSYLYRHDDFTDLDAVVFHEQEDYSTVYVRVNMADLKYEKTDYLPAYTASYQITYKLSSSYESREVIDSMTYVFQDTLHFGRDVSKTEIFRIPAKNGNQYILSVELSDLNMEKRVKKFIAITKVSGYGQQDFLLLNRNLMPVFRNYVAPSEEFRLRPKDDRPEVLYVSCYFRDFPVAQPPFVSEREDPFDYRPDSLFTVEIEGDITPWITLEKEGFYHFQADTAVREGFTVFRFHDHFPELNTADQLIRPLRYITTRKEYESVSMAADRKAALDDFWLSTAGNPARAASILRKYYNNVEEANQYFTSYKEGWKTDRGIIYVIFGKPAVVYRGDSTEEWIYGEPGNRNSLRFTFVKVNNPFTMSDYMLLRSPTYKDPWYITVQSWRR